VGRILVLGSGIILVFAAVAFVVSRLIPGPPSNTDYLVIGTAATFVSLITLFLILIKTWVSYPNVFSSKRRRRVSEATQSTARTSTSA
jgi:hypothetical protein